MFGTIVISPASQTGNITHPGVRSTLVVADNALVHVDRGTIRGAGSTRIGLGPGAEHGRRTPASSGVWDANVGGLVPLRVHAGSP